MLGTVYPSPAGHLVIGRYPHRRPFPDKVLLNPARQPFLILAWDTQGKTWVTIAAQDTESHALLFASADSYLVHPAQKKG